MPKLLTMQKPFGKSGSTPYYADKMVFNQSYSVSSGTLTVTGGWGSGASLSYNPSKSEGSWKSEPITSTFNETVSKPNMVFSSGTALYSVTFSDTVDIYIPGNTPTIGKCIFKLTNYES